MWLKKGDKEARRVHHQPDQRADTVTPKSKSSQCTEVSLSETLRREDLGPFGREEKTSSPKPCLFHEFLIIPQGWWDLEKQKKI